MTTFNMTKVEKFPQVTRSGKTSAELQMIIEALHLSYNLGENFSILDIEEGKKFNTMQQRIRAQAKKLNYKVVIHFSRSESALYFKVINNSLGTSVSIPVKDVKSIQKNASPKTK